MEYVGGNDDLFIYVLPMCALTASQWSYEPIDNTYTKINRINLFEGK